MKFAALVLGAVFATALGTPAQQRRVLLEADCSSVNFMFGDYPVAYAVQQTTVPMSVGELQVNPGGNGGIKIRRGTGSAYAVTACIGAGASSPAEAQRLADAVRIVVEGNRVRVEPAPRSQSWGVHLIVEAPPGAHIHAETSNGPLGVDGVDGRLTLRASNGPIGIEEVSGTVDARAQNGPISVAGSRGNVTVETENGPISVELLGSRWEGRLDARAHNGPLTVRVPDRYSSGVEISSADRSPWNCRIAACQAGNRDWDDRSRSLRFGGDPVVVRVTTVNGPLTVSPR